MVVVLLASLVFSSSALAATTRVDATTSNGTFTLPNPWLSSSPVGLPAPGHFGGSVLYSTTTNGTATFTFTGTGVSLVYAKWFNRGIAAVSVNGGPETLIDMYAPGVSGDLGTVSPQQVTPVASGLPDGPLHTLRIRVTGTRNPAATDNLINVDAFDVVTPDPPVVSTPASSLWSIGLGILAAGALAAVVARKRLV